jgi:hypothetical protein
MTEVLEQVDAQVDAQVTEAPVKKDYSVMTNDEINNIN